MAFVLASATKGSMQHLQVHTNTTQQYQFADPVQGSNMSRGLHTHMYTLGNKLIARFSKSNAIELGCNKCMVPPQLTSWTCVQEWVSGCRGQPFPGHCSDPNTSTSQRAHSSDIRCEVEGRRNEGEKKNESIKTCKNMEVGMRMKGSLALPHSTSPHFNLNIVLALK